jgi:hypothetical protein
MSDAFRTVTSGERFRPSARAWNALMKLAQAYEGGGMDPTGMSALGLSNPAPVLVRNDSGADRDEFEVLGIDGALVLPSDGDMPASQFKTVLAVKGVTPVDPDHLGRFVILAGPVKAGAIGRGYLAGACPAKIDVPDEDVERPFAEIDDGVSGSLKAVRCGSAGILWREGGTGVQWAIVRLGKRAVPQLFPVDLAQTGGDQGDESNPATWTYDVTVPATGDTLASGVDPVASPHKWQRPSVGQMIAATFGYAHWNEDDELVLGWINEMVDQEACDDTPEGQ